jgi:hypothetical protein
MPSSKQQNDPSTLAHVGAWIVELSTNTTSVDIILEPHPDIHNVSKQSTAAILAGHYPSATTKSSGQCAKDTPQVHEKSREVRGGAESTYAEPSWSERAA